MSTIIKRTEYTPLDPGLYPAQVEEVELADGQYGRQVKVKFQIDDDEEQGLEDRFLIGWASASFGPKSKLWAWARVLLFGGRDIPDEFEEIDIDTLKGRRCLLSVTTKQGADGGTYNKIADLLPVRPAKAAKGGNGPAPAGPPAAPVLVNQQSGPGEQPAWLVDGDDLPF